MREQWIPGSPSPPTESLDTRPEGCMHETIEADIIFSAQTIFSAQCTVWCNQKCTIGFNGWKILRNRGRGVCTRWLTIWANTPSPLWEPMVFVFEQCLYYVCLVPTWCHSCVKCSHAFPVLQVRITLPLICKHQPKEKNKNKKNMGGLVTKPGILLPLAYIVFHLSCIYTYAHSNAN